MRQLKICALLAVVFASCGPPAAPPPPEKIHTTYRIIAGVSMGGIGAAALGLSHPDKFDGVASLGGPLDAAFFQHAVDDLLLGGFCRREDLEAILASDPVKLNDPATINACAVKPVYGKWEHHNDFNHWHPTNNGGTFDRDSYINMVSDLALGLGNVFTDNPNSPFAPPGIDPAHVADPPSDFCSNPKVVKGLVNAEFNPQGTYDAITFCDGQPTMYFCKDTQEPVDFCSDPANIANPLPVSQAAAFAGTWCAGKGGPVVANKNDNALYFLRHAGEVDPCRVATKPIGGMLAFDYNGNGRRDYGEPVLNNGQERYDDVGVDGCADEFEDGNGGCSTTMTGTADANHDDYDAETNPLGTEKNWRHDDGEPFRDFGLDGVNGTGDTGEGNGAFDMNEGRKRLFAWDGRTNFLKLSEAERKRLNVMADGGIRDVMHLGLMAMNMMGAVRAVREIGAYRDFVDIPGMKDNRTGLFNPWNNRWGRVARDLLMLFGKDNPTDADLIAGEGDHVGTPSEATNRFAVAFNWAALTWPSLERPVTELGGSTASERQRSEWFNSTVLGAKWEYAVALPPGYDDPANADKRYPVMYMLHGYGMDPAGFLATSLITDSYTYDTDVKFRPMIYVFPYGRCCFVNAQGQKDCREKDDNGVDLGPAGGWNRECHSGTFWINRVGYTGQDNTRYGDAFFELIDHVDETYRTMKPADVEAR